MYKTYVDDIFAIVEGGAGKGPEAGQKIEGGLNELDAGGSGKVGVKL